MFGFFKRKGERGAGKAPCPPETPATPANGWLSSLTYGSSPYGGDSKALLLSTVYRCVEVISDSVAQLPLEPYRIDGNGYRSKHVSHPSYYLLNREPEPRMSRFTFMKTLITSVLLNGNGYALIERDGHGNATALRLLHPGEVALYESPAERNGSQGRIMYGVYRMDRMLDDSEVIHVLNFSVDGVHGISTLAHARHTLELSTDNEAHARGFFKGGANLAGIIGVDGVLSKQQREDIKAGWESTFSAQSGKPNGVAVLSGNMKFQPVTVNPVDSQLLETRKFNVIDVCRFFGVSPVKAFDLSHSSYSTVEATQLAFLTDTLAPLLEKIELEFERKLFRPSEKRGIEVRFDTSVLLRADISSQAAYYNTLFQIGAISPNEIRKNLNMEALEDGDHTFCQVNVQPLSRAVHGNSEQ
jgi:HK97 family phage portal protein